MKRKFLRPVILVVILVVLLIQLGKQQASSVASFDTQQVEKQSVEDVITAEGKVLAEKSATLNFAAPAKITFVGVKKGDRVVLNQRLLGVDAKELANQIVAAEYQYLAAEAKAKEVEDSVQGHEDDESFSQKTVRIAAQTARDMAYDAWQLARRQVQDANLYAPFSGIVTQVTANVVGDRVSPTEGITIIDPSTLYFEAAVDELDFGKVKMGQEVIIKLDAFPGEEYKAKVKYISPVGEKTQSGGVKVFVDVNFDRLPNNIVTELNGEAKFPLSSHEALVIPNSFVTNKNQKSYVNIVEGQRVKEVEVNLGEKYGDKVEVISGLTSTDTVAKKKG